MNNWEYQNPVKIIFGKNSRNRLIDFLVNKKYLIISSKRGYDFILKDPILKDYIAKENIIDCVNKYPDLEMLEKIFEHIGDRNFDLIVGFGGGSVIDTAKALIYALSLNDRNLNLEKIIDSKKSLNLNKSKELIAIPTTFGTGSEVTPYSTLWNFKIKKKFSLVNNIMYPDVAIIDGSLGLNMPDSILISTGLDAINQAMESLWNKNANSLTINYSINSIHLGMNSLPKLLENKSDINLWEQMSQCSLMAGIAISQTRTALCHSISYPITAHFGVPHGYACAFTMKETLKYCINEDDGRFLKLSNIFGYSKDYKKQLIDKFTEFHDLLEINKFIKNYISNVDLLMQISKEFYYPGRADNLMREVDLKIIEKIILDSYV